MWVRSTSSSSIFANKLKVIKKPLNFKEGTKTNEPLGWLMTKILLYLPDRVSERVSSYDLLLKPQRIIDLQLIAPAATYQDKITLWGFCEYDEITN
jgi:hypothetical protein